MLNTALNLLANSPSRQAWWNLVVENALPCPANTSLPQLMPNEVQTIISIISDKERMLAAALTCIAFIEIIARHVTDKTTPRILNLCCGWSRIEQFLPLPMSIQNVCVTYAFERPIASCRELLSSMRFEVIVSGESQPPEDASYNVVVRNLAVSYLSESSRLFHMCETTQIVRLDGLFLSTTLARILRSWSLATRPSISTKRVALTERPRGPYCKIWRGS